MNWLTFIAAIFSDASLQEPAAQFIATYLKANVPVELQPDVKAVLASVANKL